MGARGYRQFCPIARTLDIVGERWTLIIVRDLTIRGPQRFTDLRQGLPGMAPNVLSARLKRLLDAGIIQQHRLPPPAASTVYELTELGLGLKPVLAELIAWGAHLMDEPAADDLVDVEWMIAAIEVLARPEAAGGVSETYELRVDDTTFNARVADGRVSIQKGSASKPDVTITTDAATFVAVGLGKLDVMEAVERALVEIEGSAEAALRAVGVLGSGFSDRVAGGAQRSSGGLSEHGVASG